MAKFLLTNWETVPFKKKSFEGQLDRFLKVSIATVDNPQKVLLTLPLYGNDYGGGFSHLIELVRNYEVGKEEKSKIPFEELLQPIDGEFVDIPSKHGPLYKTYTKDDAKYGLCSKEFVGKAERTPTGKIKIYHTIKVFTPLIINNETGQKEIISGWSPEKLYYRFFGYNYHILADLTEPLQL
jgi:hypothetical protein